MKLKNIISLILVVFIFSGTSICNAKSKNNDKNNYGINVPIRGNINQIEIRSDIDVVYSYGNPSISIKGSNDITSYVNVQQQNNTVILSLAPNFEQDKKKKTVKVYITSKSLNMVSVYGSGGIDIISNLNEFNFTGIVRGSGDINTKGINCNGKLSLTVQGSGDISAEGYCKSGQTDIVLNGSGDIDIKSINSNKISGILNGSGDISIKGIDANYLDLSLSGSGDIYASGKVLKANYSLKQSGNIEASKVNAQNVVAFLTGSGDIECRASVSLKGSIRGSGDIEYKGNPKVQINKMR